MNFDTYTFRAHSIGKIMGGIPKPLSKDQSETLEAYEKRFSGEGRKLTDIQLGKLIDLRRKRDAKCKLTDSSKKYLEKIVWEEVTGRRQVLTAKYLDKGIQVEEKSISLYSRINKSFFRKNTERKHNEFFEGEPDNAKDIIRDIKSSWSYKTFPLTETKINNSDYEWQVQIYMDLFRLKKAELIYCLVDTPFKLLNEEIRRMDYKYDLTDLEGNVKKENIPLVVETVCNHIFTLEGLKDFCNQSSVVFLKWFEGVFKEVPEELRVKTFYFDYDPKMISQAKEMVNLSRDYMNKILENVGLEIINNQKYLKTA